MRQLRIIQQVTNRESPALDKYLREVAKFNRITPDEEAVLAQKIRQGDRKALEALVNANLRFVISVAKQYQNQGLPLPDLINEGNLGLVKAAERFDETKGFKFISYAVWWIRQAILQALTEQARIVRLPLNRLGSFNQIIKVFNDLEQEYQREPMPEEVGDHLNLAPNAVDAALNSSNYHISLDTSFKDDDNAEYNLYDLLLLNDTAEPDSNLLNKSLKEDIDRTLETLSDRESEILKYYYGLNGFHSHSLIEIGSKLQITRERVRQIKDKALKKLQYARKHEILKIYVA
jgi:RNA polymerase primary sigma factor